MNRMRVLIDGYNNDVPLSGFEDLTPAGGTVTWPTQARVHEVFSGDGADDEGSTGAEKVVVIGVNDEGRLVEEEVTLDGTNHIDTVNSYLMINDVYVSQVGGGGVNAGAISVLAKTDSTTSRHIAVGDNRQR